MGEKLAEYFTRAQSLGGILAKVKLAQKTLAPSTQAAAVADSPDLLAAFAKALTEIESEFAPTPADPIHAVGARPAASTGTARILPGAPSETERLRRFQAVYVEMMSQRGLFLGHRERTIAADDAHTDPRTSEFSMGYLRPLGIGALLDVPIWTRDGMAGVVCHEHKGGARTWTADEEAFAYMMGGFVALTLELGK